MTIGMLLRDCLSGIILNNKTVQVDFGSQKDLVQWIDNRNKSKLIKYPLIWCVIDSYNDIGTQWDCKVRFILFQQTNFEYLNKDRYVYVYTETLNPLYELLKKKLLSNRNLYFNGKPNDLFKGIIDVPNYGVNFDTSVLNRAETDFTRTAERNTKSIAQDYLDGKYFDLTFKINKKLCLIHT